MRTRMLFVGLLAALALPAAAHAKGISLVAACGATGCKDVTRIAGDSTPFPNGVAARAPTTSAPFVRIVIVIAEPADAAGRGDVIAKQSYIYVPSLHLARTLGPGRAHKRQVWQHVDALAQQTLGRMLYGIERFPARRLDELGRSPAVKLPPRHPVAMNRSSGPVDGTPHYKPITEDPRGDSSGIAWWIWPVGGLAALLAAGLIARRANAVRAT